jgi:hypothetical protein
MGGVRWLWDGQFKKSKRQPRRFPAKRRVVRNQSSGNQFVCFGASQAYGRRKKIRGDFASRVRAGYYDILHGQQLFDALKCIVCKKTPKGAAQRGPKSFW